MKKELKLKKTKIFFGTDEVFLKKLPKLAEKHKVALITDTHIEKLYRPQLDKIDLKVFSFKAGESSKTREMKITLEDHLLSHKFGRDSILVGLGGGVVGDLSGFIASTYLRGIDHIQIPTSLLGMVDAAIGGKNGVNTPYGKNLIGTFYPPAQVWIDSTFLKTLPQRQMINGFVEMVKAALIASPSQFEKLKTGPFDTIELIYKSVLIKKKIIAKDPEEKKGLRRILNLGHTFGHALEILENYKIEHGEAVAIGILASCFISQKMGYLEPETTQKIWDLFKYYKVPLTYYYPHSLEEWVSTLAFDKKTLKGTPRVVLIEAIGKPLSFDGEYCTELDFSLIEETITWMHENFYRPSF